MLVFFKTSAFWCLQVVDYRWHEGWAIGCISLIESELKRLEVLEKVKSGYCRQGSAVRVLGISTRQTRRFLRRLKQEGPRGIISRKVGAASNHGLAIVDYAGFDAAESVILSLAEHKL